VKSLRKHSPKLAPVLSWSRGVSRERKRPWRGSVEADPVPPTPYFADLTRLAEMKRVAAEIANREPPIDVLINNAGALFGTRRLTEDGLEHTFALNHMSYFVVTEGLRERLLASGAARIVNTASAAHSGCHSGFRRSSIREELQSHEGL
jgi:NAD(P)-dependent dehydrogenase (short-subunit alcohol dehydrogenase family)